nr:recombinase family protein [Solihabitans fulvus]
MNTSAASAAGKVTHEHLRRDAYLYVRQSTLKQVLSNTESATRQYALRGRAVALGWDQSQVIVIDTDQGQSGASAADRESFQRLVAEVGMGHAGIVLGLVRDGTDTVVRDPDASVAGAVARVFDTFTATGSALAVVKAFAADGLLFPRRLATGPREGELSWGQLEHSRVLQVLHNPRYAGAFFYGRHAHGRGPGGKATTRVLPREEWTVLITDAHVGYIRWDQFEANQTRLAANATAHGKDRRASPPREGPALLQGMVVCGKCGGQMTVRYHTRKGIEVPEYVCQSEGIQRGKAICQRIPGAGIDAAVGRILLDTLTPLALETALTVAGRKPERAGQPRHLPRLVPRRRQRHRDRREQPVLATKRIRTTNHPGRPGRPDLLGQRPGPLPPRRRHQLRRPLRRRGRRPGVVPAPRPHRQPSHPATHHHSRPQRHHATR